MAKKSKKSPVGTSYHNVTICCTPQQLIDLLGPAQWGDNDGRDKVNFDWVCETERGAVFTIYDWKYYRPLDLDEQVNFHIGANGFMTSQTAREELITALSKKFAESF